MTERTDETTPTRSEPPGRLPGVLGRLRAPRVFLPAAALMVLFVGLAALFPAKLGDLLTTANTTVVQDLGWWYVALVTGFVVFALWAALSPVGETVLGQDDAEPEFRLRSWFAMLFAAGMGIGLVFYGVAEPLMHYAAPPPGSATTGDPSAARTALDTTFLHWGLHAWAIYVVVGLAVAYAVHRRGRPISLRYALEPLFGKRVLGFWGDVIDVVAIVGTLFGVATSLGLGVTQIGAGLSFLGVVEEAGNGLLVMLIVAITALALVSVISGLDKGIKMLSDVNMVIALGLLVAVLLLGPTVFLLSDFVTQIGSYLQNFLRLSFDVKPFHGTAGSEWLSGWTTYYWGWWMSWAPFVGIFIARISRGRTVREFVLGVMLVPTLLTFLWFSVLGGSAIHRELFGDGGLIGDKGVVNADTALFQLFEGLPASGLLSVVAIVLIVIFFVTSSDSGSFVVDMLAEGGELNPPVWSRAFWGAMEGLVAVVLLLAGGLAALQTSAILVAAPFSVVMVLMVIATTKGLLAENRERQRARRRWLAEQIAADVRADNGETVGSRTT